MKISQVLLVLFLLNCCKCLQDDAQNGKHASESVLSDRRHPNVRVVDEANIDDIQSKWEEFDEYTVSTDHDRMVDQETLVGGASTLKELHDLSPDQAAQRIKNFVVAMDTNKDRLVNRDELVKWLKRSKVKYLLDDPLVLDHLVEEQLLRYDTNRDGYITIKEYVEGHGGVSEWVRQERSEVANEMDRNGNGHLDPEELRVWLISEEARFVLEEAEHLIHSADLNKDGQLSTDEVLQEMDVFLDNTADNTGQNTHQEL